MKKTYKQCIAGLLGAALLVSTPVCAQAAGVVVAGGESGGANSQAGPGVSSGNVTEIPGRVDYFSASVSNPVVPTTASYSYERMVQDIQSLQARYGSHMTVNTIGTSLDGRAIYEIVLGNVNAEKHILIHAGIHAREHMTSLLVMKQLEYGLAFYNSGNYAGTSLSELLNRVAVHFVPMVNPDGIALCQNGIDAIRSSQLRDTIRQCYADDTAQGRTAASFEDYLLRWKSNARGVDLNQNFPADWEAVDSCPNPSYAVYRGPSALSELESQALAALADSRSWAASISYHSTGNLIYWDYAGNRVQQASGELATIVSANTSCPTANSSGHGGFKDWAQIKDNPIPSLTIETGSVACPLPLSEYTDVWNRNKMVWALVALYAMNH